MKLSREFVEAVTGSTSSVIANALVYPLDVITTRVQVRRGGGEEDSAKSPTVPLKISMAAARQKKSKWQMILDIYKAKGVLGFYIGMRMALLQTFWSSLFYFYIYSWIKKMYYKYGSKEKGIAVELLQGAVAGAISRFLTTPISVITTRLQAGNGKDYDQIIKNIRKEDGVTGFWRGYKASLILTVNPAITYGVFEYVKNLLPNDSPLQSFFLGAFTKSIATIVTYPYILAKTRLQAGSRRGIMGSMRDAIRDDGVLGLFEGVNEQLSKSVLCQALLFALKDYLAGLYSWIPVSSAAVDAENEHVVA